MKTWSLPGEKRPEDSTLELTVLILVAEITTVGKFEGLQLKVPNFPTHSSDPAIFTCIGPSESPRLHIIPGCNFLHSGFALIDRPTADNPYAFLWIVA
jgi:hypothetical protein